MNTRFIKKTDNRILIKERKNIVLHNITMMENPTTGEMHEVKGVIVNPTNEVLFADGWEIYIEPVKPEPTEEELLNEAKHNKLTEVNRYDSSRDVNEFYIQEMPVWLDKATRSGLMLRFNSELALKKENTTLWYEGYSFTLPLNTAMQMLYALEVYASECYDNTQLHLANIEKIETIEELDAYDYRTGYPDKLHF
jgi:hypothetical protein